MCTYVTETSGEWLQTINFVAGESLSLPYPTHHIPHQGAQQVNVLHFQSNHMHVFQPAIQPAKRTSLFQSTSLITSINYACIFLTSNDIRELYFLACNPGYFPASKAWLRFEHCVFTNRYVFLTTYAFLMHVFPPVTSIHSSYMYSLPIITLKHVFFTSNLVYIPHVCISYH